MNILITGSNGFVGSKLMWRLEEIGHKVIGLDISTQCEQKPHPKTMIGDVRQLNDLHRIAKTFHEETKSTIDMVIHCAASKHDFGVSDDEYYSHNKTGTKVLLDFISLCQINRLIYFSSVSIYGYPPEPTDEDGVFAPENAYGCSKLAGELLCTEWSKLNSRHELIVLRPTAIYGPYNYANLYKMMDMMHRHPILMIGKGDYVKTLVSIENMIDMTVFALSIMRQGAQYYICCDEPNITVKHLMELIAQNPAFKIPRIHIPTSLAVLIGRIFDVPAKILRVDIPVSSHRMHKLSSISNFVSKRIRAAGYVQRYSTESQIDLTAHWYLSVNMDNRRHRVSEE